MAVLYQAHQSFGARLPSWDNPSIFLCQSPNWLLQYLLPLSMLIQLSLINFRAVTLLYNKLMIRYLLFLLVPNCNDRWPSPLSKSYNHSYWSLSLPTVTRGAPYIPSSLSWLQSAKEWRQLVARCFPAASDGAVDRTPFLTKIQTVKYNSTPRLNKFHSQYSPSYWVQTSSFLFFLLSIA